MSDINTCWTPDTLLSSVYRGEMTCIVMMMIELEEIISTHTHRHRTRYWQRRIDIDKKNSRLCHRHMYVITCFSVDIIHVRHQTIRGVYSL